jgi:FimV-like protein
MEKKHITRRLSPQILGVKKFLYCFLACMLLGICSCSSNSPENLYEKGKAALENENLRTALVYFQNALERDPSFTSARVELAKTYKLLHMSRKALIEYKILLEEGQSPVYRIEVAELLLDTKDPQGALYESETLIAGNYNSTVVAHGYFLKGLALREKGELQASSGNLGKALKLNPAEVEAHLELAINSLAGADFDTSRAHVDTYLSVSPDEPRGHMTLFALEKSEGNVEEALRAADRVIALDPDNQVVLYQKGVYLLDLGREDGARQVAAELLSRFPKSSETFRFNGFISYLNGDMNEAVSYLLSSLKGGATLETYYYLGLAEYNLQNFELASMHLRKAVDLNTEHLPSRLLLSHVFTIMGHYGQALHEAHQAVKIDPDNTKAYSLKGTAFLMSGDFRGAMYEFEKAAELDPENASSYLKTSFMELLQGNESKADGFLKKAIASEPGNFQVRLVAYSVYMRNRKYDRAIAVMEDGLTGEKKDAIYYNYMAACAEKEGDRDKAFQYLDKAAEADPRYSETYFSRASLYMNSRKPAEAIGALRRVLAFDPENSLAYYRLAFAHFLQNDLDAMLSDLETARKYADAALLQDIAALYILEGKYDLALQTIDEAVQSSIGSCSALAYKGDVLLEIGKTDDASLAYEELSGCNEVLGLARQMHMHLTLEDDLQADLKAQALLEKQPNIQGHYIVSSIYAQNAKTKTAVNVLRKGLLIDDQSISALFLLGKLYNESGLYGTALSIFDKIINLYPEQFHGYFGRAVLLEKTSQLQEAEEYYLKALQRNPNFVPALNNLSFVLSSNDKPKQALAYALAAFQLEPNNPVVLDSLGYALLKNDKADAALRALERSFRIDPAQNNTMYHLALAYSELGQVEKAKDTLRKLLQSGDSAVSKQAEKLLRDLS